MSRNLRLQYFVLSWFSLTFSVSALAVPNDFGQAIDLAADQVELDRQAATSTYRGNVKFTQGTLQITADKIVIRQRGEGKNQHIIADISGKPVRYSQQRKDFQPIVAEAPKIQYRSDREELVLSGGARILQGAGNQLNSQTIRYFVQQDRIVAGGAVGDGERVTITFQPPQNTNE